MQLADKRGAYRTVIAQLSVGIIAAILLLALGWVHAYSGFAGGAISALTNAFFAKKMFVHYTAQEPGKLLAKFYVAEISKLILAGLLFAGVILWIKPLSVGALFGVFLLVQMVPVFVAQRLD